MCEDTKPGLQQQKPYDQEPRRVTLNLVSIYKPTGSSPFSLGKGSYLLNSTIQDFLTSQSTHRTLHLQIIAKQQVIVRGTLVI